MVATIKTSIAIPKSLLTQADRVAQQFNISRSQLFELAVDNFISNYHLLDQVQAEPNQQSTSQSAEGQLRINQGDVYWVLLEDGGGSEVGIPHPHVVIQENSFNHSRIHTVVACALTTNLKRASLPGSILLEVGEANLPKQSVVEASKISTIDKTQLGEYIGSLTDLRINQILASIRFLQLSFFNR
jgi:mRNA interferase MazF